ncbi:MAG: ribonuclease HI family protein [Terriglobales bacterium]
METVTSPDLVVQIDGGSRGNPGPAGYGVVIRDGAGALCERLHAFVGVQTNNYAEYCGLLAGLRYALARQARRVRVLSDSLLLVRQMQGRYAVKSQNLRPLFEEARALAQQLPEFSIAHVYRERNREADRLANQAMDEAKTASEG